jgi:hypothetical protein
MKNTGLLLGFTPLIVYGLLTGISASSVTIALAAAAATTILAGYADLRRGMILPWTNLGLWGGTLFAITVLKMNWIASYLGTLIYGTLAVVAFGSLVTGNPFTLQYARGMVDPKIHEHPLFIRTNLFMTGVWGGVFALNFLLSVVEMAIPGFFGRILQALT